MGNEIFVFVFLCGAVMLIIAATVWSFLPRLRTRNNMDGNRLWWTLVASAAVGLIVKSVTWSHLGDLLASGVIDAGVSGFMRRVLYGQSLLSVGLSAILFAALGVSMVNRRVGSVGFHASIPLNISLAVLAVQSFLSPYVYFAAASRHHNPDPLGDACRVFATFWDALVPIGFACMAFVFVVIAIAWVGVRKNTRQQFAAPCEPNHERRFWTLEIGLLLALCLSMATGLSVVRAGHDIVGRALMQCREDPARE